METLDRSYLLAHRFGMTRHRFSFARTREDGRSQVGGSMKFKDHNLTERERRLKAVDTPLLQQARIVRAALLTIVLFGVAALAGVVSYLAWPYSIPGL